MSRPFRLAALLAVGALMLVMAPASTQAGTGDSPTATASKRCSVGSGRGYGTTYVRSISTRRVGCSRAKAIIRAFHGCRKGARGRCGRVSGYSCSENRNSGVGSFDSNVSCRRGGKRVRHAYTQFT